jgi:CheY-like chemotaxis protein
MLSLLGHQVDLAFGGQEGLLRFSEKDYDLIFTDMGMPDLSGLEVAKAIKEKSPSIPLLLVTGWGDQVDPLQAKQFGIRTVIAKPFRMGEIIQAMREATLPPS